MRSVLEPSCARVISPRSSTSATRSPSTACPVRFHASLVRHRLASFNQQSQRYVKFTDGLETIKRRRLPAMPRRTACSMRAIEQAKDAYARLVELGVPAEDARYLLPNAAETKIVVTMNVRELLHFFALRCCNRAQWEIRDLAHRMLELVRPTAPFVFLDAGAPCVHRGTAPRQDVLRQPLPACEQELNVAKGTEGKAERSVARILRGWRAQDPHRRSGAHRGHYDARHLQLGGCRARTRRRHALGRARPRVGSQRRTAGFAGPSSAAARRWSSRSCSASKRSR